MSRTYVLGTLGAGGITVNFAGGQRFDSMNNGEFKSKSEARKAAADVAKMFAMDSEDGVSEVAIVADAGEGIPDLIAVATATRGRKNVSWE